MSPCRKIEILTYQMKLNVNSSTVVNTLSDRLPNADYYCFFIICLSLAVCACNETKTNVIRTSIQHKSISVYPISLITLVSDRFNFLLSVQPNLLLYSTTQMQHYI